MKIITLYANGSSQNHGCEALLKATIRIIGKEHHYIAATTDPGCEEPIKNVEYLGYSYKKHYSILTRVMKKYKLIKVAKGKYSFKQFEEVFRRSDIAVSIGGDNYCYGDSEWLYLLHRMASDQQIPTVLYGCSIEESMIDSRMLEDLDRFDLIIARETITYSTLLKSGLAGDKVKFYPDSAFSLEKKILPLPWGFGKNGIVGINISPLVIRRNERAGCIESNLKLLVNYILVYTAMDVMLVPHVVTPDNDDMEPLKALKQSFAYNERVLCLENYHAEEIKGFIARCRFFIGARTHASIAAYSSEVPTLVIGYSVKSRGIARDLFGTDANYVIGTDQITSNDRLLQSFQWLMRNEDAIRKHLESKMPAYCSKAEEAGKEIRRVLERKNGYEWRV